MTNPLLLLVRRLGLSRNPLYRSTDRIEGVILALTIIWALLSVPAAAAIGTMTYDSSERFARTQAERLEQVQARVVETSGDPLFVTVEWTDRNGTERVDTIRAGPSAVKGDQLPIWLDHSGQPAETPPPTHSDMVSSGVWAALLALVALESVAIIVYQSAKALLRRISMARWQAEWSEVERQWRR